MMIIIHWIAVMGAAGLGDVRNLGKGKKSYMIRNPAIGKESSGGTVIGNISGNVWIGY
jgi:hypothetical protein